MLIDDPALRARARETILEIVGALAAHPPAPGDSDALADLAILRTYLATDDTLADPDDASGSALHAAIARVPALRRSALHGGVAHVGWAIAHLVAESEADVACPPLDAALHQALATLPDYDLIGGVVGIGVYALERGTAGHPLASAVLDELERRARPYGDDGGIAWHTAPELLPDYQRDRAPDGYWNLGVAHGVPGAIALLARLSAAGIEPARCRKLLDGAVAFLLGAAPATAAPRFTGWLPGDVPAGGRLAWCYGDLGIAAVLLSLPDEQWRSEGLALAHACAARAAEPGHLDASMCHGAAGTAHLFHRMALATGDATLAAAARRFIERTLAARSAEPIAGFPYWAVDDGWQPDATLLQGATGVALVLHAAISDVEPAWDRLLLCDLAPAPS